LGRKYQGKDSRHWLCFSKENLMNLCRFKSSSNAAVRLLHSLSPQMQLTPSGVCVLMNELLVHIILDINTEGSDKSSKQNQRLSLLLVTFFVF
jgi:hypothetical protein